MDGRRGACSSPKLLSCSWPRVPGQAGASDLARPPSTLPKGQGSLGLRGEVQTWVPALHRPGKSLRLWVLLPCPLPGEKLPTGLSGGGTSSQRGPGRVEEPSGRREEEYFRPPPASSQTEDRVWGLPFGPTALSPGGRFPRSVATTCWFSPGPHASGETPSGLSGSPSHPVLFYSLLL